MSEEVKDSEFAVNPLIYFQKPAIGRNGDDLPPIQAVFPNGGFGLGIPIKVAEENELLQPDNIRSGVLASAPMNDNIDQYQKHALMLGFLCFGMSNLILTILMFVHADVVDLSRVEPIQGGLPTVFQLVSTNRTFTEKVNFGFVVFLLLLGMFSAVFENTLGLSMYALGITLNFFLASYALPNFIYSYRYLLDFAMLYMGLVLRSRLVFAFLPVFLNLNQQRR